MSREVLRRHALQSATIYYSIDRATGKKTKIGSSYQLRRGVVVSQGRFEAGRLGVHIGIEILQTGAIAHPSWGRVHRYPLVPFEPCQFCKSYTA